MNKTNKSNKFDSYFICFYDLYLLLDEKYFYLARTEL